MQIVPVQIVRCVLVFALLLSVPVALATVAVGADSATSFDSNGVKIHYLDQGSGEPVVLVHGFSASGVLNWSLPGIVQLLRKNDYRVITIDNRGHGRSDKPHDPEKYGLEMVGDITRLMDHLQIPKAHVVGYSMGAFLTCKLLTTSPDRLISATLGGAGWPREDDPRLSIMSELADSLESGKGLGPLIRALTPPDRPQPTDQQLADISQMAMLINDPMALAAVARGGSNLMVPEADLRKNRLPVMALVGDLDPLKSSIDGLVGILPKLQVVVIEGADHDNAFTRSEFKSSLLEFLDAHRTVPKSVKSRAEATVGAAN